MNIATNMKYQYDQISYQTCHCYNIKQIQSYNIIKLNKS